MHLLIMQQKSEQYYSSLYFNLQDFTLETRREAILNRMVARIPGIYCVLGSLRGLFKVFDQH